MKLAITIGSREIGFTIGKSLSASAAAFMRGDDSPQSGAQLSSAYEQSTWIYSCIGAIAKQLAQIPLRVSRGTRMPQKARTVKWRRRAVGEDLIEGGPLVELMNRPHPQLTRFDFWYLCVAWLMLRGEVFSVPTTDTSEPVILDTPGRGGKLIRRLVILNPANFREEIQAHMLMGWCYYGHTRTPMKSYTFLPEEVVYSKLPNPYDFWRGMAPLTVAQLAAQTDYASAQFLKGLMLNNADTGVIVTTDQQPDPEQREDLMAALRERKRKAGTADRPLLLWGGMKVEKPTLTSADMQFLENRKFNRQEICSIYQTPQEVLGFTEDANRSVSDSARLNFIENTIAGICELLEVGFEPVARAYDKNFFVWFDIDSLPIMQRARQTRFATATTTMQGMGVPLNILNGIFDLGLPDDLPHGDSVFLPFSMQEYGTPQEKPAPAVEQEETEDTEEAKGNPFTRMQKLLTEATQNEERLKHICKANPDFERSIEDSIRLKKGKLSKFFFEQRGRVLAKISELNIPDDAKSLTSKGVTSNLRRHLQDNPLGYEFSYRALDDIFNRSKEDEALWKKIKPTLIADLEFGGAQIWQDIGLSDFKLKPADATRFLDKRKNVIQDINETTFNSLKSSLKAGLDAGESFEQLTDRVKSIYQNASVGRAEVIAVTETNVAINSGRNQAMVDAKVERKGWQTSNLENTRASHLVNQQLSEAQNGIPINDAWPNGCRFPCDPDGEASETINCRCFGFAILTDKAGKPSVTRGPLLDFGTWWAANRFEARFAQEVTA